LAHNQKPCAYHAPLEQQLITLSIEKTKWASCKLSTRFMLVDLQKRMDGGSSLLFIVSHHLSKKRSGIDGHQIHICRPDLRPTLGRMALLGEEISYDTLLAARVELSLGETY
jgi:hypothetical protein